jgi:zinc transport system permease protein
MLISSLILFPALTAMRLAKSFRGVILSAAGVSAVCFLAALIVSYAYNTPTGATVVVANIAAFLIALGVERLRERKPCTADAA